MEKLNNRKEIIMKNLFGDYRDLVWKPQITFIKKHWVFYTLVSLIYAIDCLIIIFPDFSMSVFDKINQLVKRVFSK